MGSWSSAAGTQHPGSLRYLASPRLHPIFPATYVSLRSKHPAISLLAVCWLTPLLPISTPMLQPSLSLTPTKQSNSTSVVSPATGVLAAQGDLHPLGLHVSCWPAVLSLQVPLALLWLFPATLPRTPRCPQNFCSYFLCYAESTYLQGVKYCSHSLVYSLLFPEFFPSGLLWAKTMMNGVFQ